jgi:hypothetical protein
VSERAETGCAFCGRSRRQVSYLVVADEVGICASCIEVGLLVARDQKPRQSEGGTEFTGLRSATDPPCDLCGRSVRLSFLGFRRTLRRMVCTETGSVMCLDCLDHRGDLVNEAAAKRHGTLS